MLLLLSSVGETCHSFNKMILTRTSNSNQVSIHCSWTFIFQIISFQLIGAFFLPCFFTSYRYTIATEPRNFPSHLSSLSVCTETFTVFPLACEHFFSFNIKQFINTYDMPRMLVAGIDAGINLCTNVPKHMATGNRLYLQATKVYHHLGSA